MHPEDLAAPPPPLRIGLPSRLGEMLIRQGLVSSEAVQSALSEQAAGSEWRLGRLLVQQGALDDRTLVQAIAHQFHVQVVDLRLESPTPAARERLPRAAALRLQALPLRVDADALVVAVSDPPVRELRVAVERSAGLPVRLVLTAADELRVALDHWYADEGSAVGTSVEPSAGAETPAEPEPEPEPVPAAAESDAPDAPDATDLRIVVWLLTEAVRRDASAIHLDHGEDGLRIRYRVDGAVVPGPLLPPTSGTLVCQRLLGAAGVDPCDDGLQEGAFDAVADGRSITCRVTALTTARDTHVVVRTDTTVRATRLEDLEIARADAAAVRAVLQEGRGVVVVASALPAAAADVCRILVDEVGPESHVVVGAMRDAGASLPGAIRLPPDGDDGHPVDAVAAARALGADVLVVDADDPAVRCDALTAASELLVVMRVAGEDPTEVAEELVAAAGAFLVAGMLRAVVVAGTDPRRAGADVHLVTEDVCRAILDLR